MIIKLYQHKGNKNYYQILQMFATEAKMKQTSDNKWEDMVAYKDVKTNTIYITGKERFKDRFELVEVEHDTI